MVDRARLRGFAGVLRKGDESGFAYTPSIFGYWKNLCAISAIASSQGTITSDVRAMLYIIGVSFTGEMGVKGLYETTIGRLTEWIRGAQKTPEDYLRWRRRNAMRRFCSSRRGTNFRLDRRWRSSGADADAAGKCCAQP